MKKLVLPIMAVTAFFSIVSAQTSSRIFAITGDTKGNVNWNAVREVSSKDGSLKSTFYTPSANQALRYVSSINKNITPSAEPAISAIAATAYDSKNNRLYFTNMRGNTLNYVDLSQQGFTVVSNADGAFNTGDKFKSEAAIITRMTFGADGAGYALSNDGEHLIRFTTGSRPIISNLGRLIDASENGNTSVHNQCTSWGGDMVGDAFGNLYLITMHASVYKINTQTLVTKLVGTIKGLPAEFTTNGAAVNEDGDLIVSGAAYTESYFKIDFGTLQVVSPVKSEGGVYNASDLASANLLYQAKATTVATAAIAATEQVSVYPNPAVGRAFQVKITKPASEKYAVQVTDISGKVVLQNSTAVGNPSLKVNLPAGTPAGVYLLKVTNTAKQTVYNNKLVVE
ncbi:T9SS type A sorting domain-containing protein [Parasediminibacterium sp. JCM 36343]|uniref:T9SS type A sorting domain-containing protein n=1 Tax=Parasediminibacterium sp. JCM 36343 TaxID=3374279 RepID=UPI00397A6038